MPTPTVQNKGNRAKILLSSVFGPYAQNDEYGSRAINPMELYHNQVTRVQGVFSLRMFHRSFGLMMIQNPGNSLGSEQSVNPDGSMHIVGKNPDLHGFQLL